MRTPVWIVIVAVAGIAVAWLLLTQAPEPKIAAASAMHVPATPPPATPDESEAAAVRAQTAIPPPVPAPVATKAPAAPVVVVPPKAAEPSTPPPVDDPDASANDESADEPEPGDEDADTPSFDAHRAADLMADWMAKQDVATGDEGSAPVPSSKDLKAFDQEEADANWSTTAEQKIEAALNQWLDALPDDIANNLDVIRVECRQTLCQVLTAESSIVPEGHAPYEPQWPQGIDTLAHQPWYQELGFADLTTAVDHDTDSGYFLYQVYLHREVKPPSE